MGKADRHKPTAATKPPKRSRSTTSSGFLSSNALIACLATALLAAALSFLSRSGTALPPSLGPFPGPRLTSLPQFAGAHAARLLWGTYRPGVYFGMRPRAPKSLILGLMWVDPGRGDALQNIRHTAQERDGLSQYGWVAHDGESYGLQRLYDEGYNISTAWVRKWGEGGDAAGDAVGGAWGARVTAAPRAGGSKTSEKQKENEVEDAYDDGEEDGTASDEKESQDPSFLSFFLYVATEDGSPVSIHVDEAVEAIEEGMYGPPGRAFPLFSGATPPFGPWTVHLNAQRAANGAAPPSHANGIAFANFLALKTPHLHNLTETVGAALYQALLAQHQAGNEDLSLVLSNAIEPGANVAVIQITAQLPLTLDFAFSTGRPDGEAASGEQEAAPAARELLGDALTARLTAAQAAFDARFAKTFGDLRGTELPSGTAAAARAALSNLLGGMGYWYGRSIVRMKGKTAGNSGKSDKIADMWDSALFSATPSRSFFPRGFLWDEGFHQLLVRRWSPALSRDALAHWLDLMTVSGWIPREQILGAEARSRVPDEFVPQSPDAANPPALFLALSDMATAAAKAGGSGDTQATADLEFLRAAWPRLRAWVGWYNETQAGPVPGSFRWRGRDAAAVREINPKTLTSGLDDYPRASHPTSDERHLDLRCWMALATGSLATVGAAAGAPPDEVSALRAAAAHLSDFAELKKLHWDAKNNRFADWGLHTEAVALRDVGDPSGEPLRVVTAPDTAPPTPQFVPHYGYVSLFPLAMNLIPKDAPELGTALKTLRQPDGVWSSAGLRSLAASSSLYGVANTRHDPPYWRGAVWVNVNYLVLRALGRYADAGGPHAAEAGAAADELRTTLLRTLVGQYGDRGYLYESYDDRTGQGKGSHPFTGWTALLALIAAEPPHSGGSDAAAHSVA